MFISILYLQHKPERAILEQRRSDFSFPVLTGGAIVPVRRTKCSHVLDTVFTFGVVRARWSKNRLVSY
jgi:hypothetical protein